MAAPFQIVSATPDEVDEIFGLEQQCYLASVMKEARTVIAYAFASR